MNKQKKQYPPEFKRQAIELLETSDKAASEIERELGITQGLLTRWKRKQAQDGPGAFSGHGRQSSAEEKIRRLERDLLIVKQEREILKKAVAIFTHPNR